MSDPSDNTPTPLAEETVSGRRRGPVPRVTQVGRYVLLKQLGEGGMGVVFAAYDPDLDRQVALKLLRPERRSHSEEARARLLREAQAMARVSHSHVLPVYDVGVWGEQVFLAMELIDGQTMGEWLRERPRPWREVLDKLLEAGQGLMAAHAVGLIHRDFKPANVLMDRRGRVYVTDFGLARQVDKPDPAEASTLSANAPPGEAVGQRMLEVELTEPGSVMGTPQYMSPEQVNGASLDARSDQFSFCVSLYWALYRQRPFDPDQLRRHLSSGSSREEGLAPTRAERKPREPAATQPSALIQEPPRDARVPAWVRQAVMRGLAVDPTERFASMKELLEALSQTARRDRRRRWTLGLSAGALGLGLVGAGMYQHSRVCAGAGELMTGVWNPQERQKVEASLLATGRPFARDLARGVLEVLDGYARDWSQQRVEACEATRLRGVQTEDVLSRREVCLERRRWDLKAVVAQLADADGAVVEKSLDAVHALPVLSECAEVEALSERQRLPVDADQRAHIQALDARVAELKALVDTGRYQAAREKASALAEEVEATHYLPLMAELHTHRGWLEQQLGRPAEAVGQLTRAAHEAEAGRADRLKTSILVRLVYIEGELRHFEAAEGWGQWADATLHRIGGDALLESALLMNQGNVADWHGQLSQARALFERARDVLQRAVPPEDPRRARVSFLLGGVLGELGEDAQAVELLRQALVQTEAAVGRMHPDSARRHMALAGVLRKMGNPADALAHARAAAEIFQGLLGPEHLQTAEAQDDVGQCLLELSRYAEALAVYRQSLDFKRRALKPDDESLQYSYDGVGQALLGLGRAHEAVEPLRRAVSFTSMDPRDLAESGFALARALWQDGQRREARAEADRAHERFSRAGQAARAAQVLAWRNAPSTP